MNLARAKEFLKVLDRVKKEKRRTGIEPVTIRAAIERSTTELPAQLVESGIEIKV